MSAIMQEEFSGDVDREIVVKGVLSPLFNVWGYDVRKTESGRYALYSEDGDYLGRTFKTVESMLQHMKSRHA